MIVRLSKNQRDAVASFGTELHQQWLTEHTTQVSKVMLDCEMPPIGWKTLVGRIAEGAFHQSGRRRGGNEVAATGLKRIATQLALIEGHPAFKGAALPGKHFERFLEWDGSPYPNPSVCAVTLIPHWIYTEPMVTKWERFDFNAKQHTHWELDPMAHWEFRHSGGTRAAAPTA